ncbi:Outer row dynein-assembly protein 7 [Novymonas esmeraldas]|uniref:Outer row dynein-assembly protein 7 n=1 Tax=Novymonas esmeraldas TaxID=1808958 RepID=A0AAW0F398_9TRYP
MADMTKELIVASCKANGGYAAPRLNDQLFLHCHGFSTIENLEPYTEAKVLWLEQNALSALSGLEGQSDCLVSLFVQNNFIRSLASLTTTLRGLRVLNVSHNYLTSLRGIAAGCPSLETLQASHNHLTSLEVCEELWQLAGTLTSVDLSFNRIESAREPPATEPPTPSSPVAAVATGEPGSTALEDDIRIVDAADVSAAASGAVALAAGPTAAALPKPDPLAIAHFFQRLPLVSVIYLHGNGLSHRLRHYRRNMILELPALTYLDERPVFPEERRVTEAWGRGGEAAESAERAAVREEKRAHLTQCVTLLTEQRETHRAVRDRLTKQFDERRAQELEELTQRRRRDRDSRAALEAAESTGRDAVEAGEQDARWDLEETVQAAHTTLAAMEAAHLHAYEQHRAVSAAAQTAAQEAAAERKAEGGASSGEDDESDSASTAAAAAVKVLEDAATCSSDGFSSTRRSSAATDLVAAPLLPPPHPPLSAALAELLQSDDDILREMEMEIEQVLFDVSCSSASASPPALASHRDVSAGLRETQHGALSSRPATDRASLRMERNMHAAVGHVTSELRAQQQHDQQRRRSSGMPRQEMWQRFEQWEARRSSQQSNP